MKPTAYITKDRRMLIFADSPNMLPADTTNLIPLFELSELNKKDSSDGCMALIRVGAGYDKIVVGVCGKDGMVCDSCKTSQQPEANRGFNLEDPVAYYRFNMSDTPILGYVRELVDRKGSRGAWISDMETGEVYFAPFSRLAHLKPKVTGV